jgi:uncharacterized membrane protein HdeD (DUF308 family)
MAIGLSTTIGLARWWWTFIVRGVLAIAFGLLAFLAPLWSIAVLIGLFAAWALIDGVTGLIAGIRTRGIDRSWWLEVVEGLVSIAAGVVTLLLPAAAAQALVLVIGAWALVTGAVEIWTAIRLRRVITGEVWLGLAGAASILFGLMLFLFPGVGALSLVWLIGSGAIVFGVFLILLGWRLRGIHELAKVDVAHDYSR